MLDGAAAGLMVEAIPDSHLFVQTAEFLQSTDDSGEQREAQTAAINGFPQATLRLRETELLEGESTLAIIQIGDSSPMAN